MKRKLIGALAGAIAAGYALRASQRQARSLDFRGKSVVITGARGLALELARLYAREGARLTLLARNPEELERAHQHLSSDSSDVFTRVCDIRDQTQVAEAIQDVVEQYGGIDVLVNNAGVIQVGPAELAELKDFEDALYTHVWGPLYLVREAVPLMKQRGGGRIVNIASIGGLVSVPHLLPYSTSKFALVGLSDGMRAELDKYGIYVTTVCPGLMRTGSHVNASFFGQYRKEFAWFSASDANPLLSMRSERAARKIVEASRYGIPRLIISIQAKLLHAMNALAPSLTSTCMNLAVQMLPAPEGSSVKRTGWESRSTWSPSILTQPADSAIVPNNEMPGPNQSTS